MKKIIFSILVATTLIQAAPLGITTQTELGYIKNTGNTDDETFALDANLKKEWDKHVAIVKITAQYGKKDTVETKNKWLIELQYDYKFTEKFAFNYILGYKNDSFSAYDYQFYTGFGAKYIPIKSDTQNLNISANILYAEDKFIDTYTYDNAGVPTIDPYPYINTGVKTATGKTRNYAAYRAALNYNLQMLKNLKFIQELSYRDDFDNSDNYFVYSKSGLSTKVSNNLSAGITYTVDYVNAPGSDKMNVDSIFTASLIINY